MAHLYRVSDTAELEAGGFAELIGDEARHAATVARLGVGEAIGLTNGAGVMAQCVVLESTPRRVRLAVDSVSRVPPLTPALWLVQALAKGDRDERAVEACTELGVDHIIPWQAARSISRWTAEKELKGVARWQRIATEASKQSLRAWVPQVAPLAQLAELRDLASRTRMVVLNPGAELSVAAAVKPGDEPVVVVVGPEGGITPEELASLEGAGALAASLGPHVMRTSSAGAAALAILNHSLSRWE